jgi:AcrR family transcriptional regulator
LLDVAQNVFADKGFDGATMADIAEAAGVTKPVLYQHFTSKRDLYGTVLSTLAQELLDEVLAAASSSNNPREQAEQGIRGYLKFVQADDKAFRILFDGANRRDPEWDAFGQEVRGTLANAIAVLIDVPSMSDERRRTLAHGIMGVVEAMSLSAWSNPEPIDPGQLADDIIMLIWSGLRGIGDEPRSLFD